MTTFQKKTNEKKTFVRFLASEYFDLRLNGSERVEFFMNSNETVSNMTMCVWLKTNQKNFHLFSYTPLDDQNDNVIALWKNGSSIYVKLWRNDR